MSNLSRGSSWYVKISYICRSFSQFISSISSERICWYCYTTPLTWTTVISSKPVLWMQWRLVQNRWCNRSTCLETWTSSELNSSQHIWFGEFRTHSVKIIVKSWLLRPGGCSVVLHKEFLYNYNIHTVVYNAGFNNSIHNARASIWQKVTRGDNLQGRQGTSRGHLL